MLMEILKLGLEGKSKQTLSLTVQYAKATEQALEHNGDWKVAWLLTGLKDPTQRTRHCGSEREVDTLANYLKVTEEMDKYCR